MPFNHMSVSPNKRKNQPMFACIFKGNFPEKKRYPMFIV